AVGERHHGLDGGEVMAVEEEDPALGSGGEVGRGGQNEGPQAVAQGGAALAGGEGRAGPDAGDHGAHGVGVAAGRGPGGEGGPQAPDAGRLTTADGDQDVRPGTGGLDHRAVGGAQGYGEPAGG